MKTEQILGIAKIVSWVLFIGLCIKAGAILFTSISSITGNPDIAKNLYLGLDLSALYGFSKQYYFYIISFIISIAALKAYLFYLVTRIFSKINLDYPFTLEIAHLISKISYYSLATGIIAMIANTYSKWLFKKGVDFQIEWGGSQFLFMAGILFIIALVFTHGVKIQEENDLTI